VYRDFSRGTKKEKKKINNKLPVISEEKQALYTLIISLSEAKPLM
jgi:hypothetical protein